MGKHNKGFSFQRSLFNCSSSLLRSLYYINEGSEGDIINVLFMTCRTVPSLNYLRFCESKIPNVRYAVDFIDSLLLTFREEVVLHLGIYCFRLNQAFEF